MPNTERENSSRRSMTFRILSICDDDGLRYSRELLLTNDGYEIDSVSSDAVLSVSQARSYDVALICRSVDTKRGMALTEMLQRYNPEIQILRIAPLESPEQLDIHLQIVPEPQLFLETVRTSCMHAVARRSYQPTQ